MALIELGVLRDYWKGVYDWVTSVSASKPYVKIDQTTPGTTNGVQVNAALPAGTNNIGDVDVASSALPTGAATSAKQDTLIAKDFATQTTLAAILAKLLTAPATEAKQDTLAALIGTLADAAVIDPTAAGTIIAELKGIVKQLQGDGTAGKAAPVSVTDRDIIAEAIHNIVDIIGVENIELFLPMWETSGSTLYDLLKRDVTFTVNGATMGQSSPFGKCLSFDGVNDYVTQNPVPNGYSITNTAIQELQAPTAIAVQKMKAFASSIGFINVRLLKEGSPDGNIKLEIRTTKDGAAITNGTSAVWACSAVTVSGDYGFYFTIPPNLVKGTTYYLALVYDSNTNADADNNVGWRYDGAGGYGQGRNHYNGSTWTDTATEDHAFAVYHNTISSITAKTIIMLAKDNSLVASGSSRVALLLPGANASVTGLNSSLTGEWAASYNDGSTRVANATRLPDSFNVWASSFEKASPNNIKIYKDGVLRGSVTGGTSADSIYQARPTLIGTDISFPTGNFLRFFNGLIGPIIITSTAMTAANIAKVSHNLLVLRKYGGAN